MRAVLLTLLLLSTGCKKKTESAEGAGPSHAPDPPPSSIPVAEKPAEPPLDNSAFRSIRDGKLKPGELKGRSVRLVAGIAKVTGNKTTLEFGVWEQKKDFFYPDDAGAVIATFPGAELSGLVYVSGVVTDVKVTELPVSASSVGARNSTYITLTLSGVKTEPKELYPKN